MLRKFQVQTVAIFTNAELLTNTTESLTHFIVTSGSSVINKYQTFATDMDSFTSYVPLTIF